MDVTPTKGADQLRQYIERIERLEAEIVDLTYEQMHCP